MDQHRVIPFFQAFQMSPYMMPGYMPFMMPQEDTSAQDLQYLQEIFPEVSRRYAKRISDVVDRLDYKGSMIYDEFPDRMRLQQLAREILQMIEADEAAMVKPQEEMRPENGVRAENGARSENGTRTEREENANVQLSMDQGTKEELIFVLLVYEIYKRRHGSSRMDMAPFYGTTF